MQWVGVFKMHLVQLKWIAVDIIKLELIKIGRAINNLIVVRSKPICVVRILYIECGILMNWT